MKSIFIFILVICNSLFAFSEEIIPDKKENPQDTLKAYYLDEVVVSSSVKETNRLKSLPTAVSVISPSQLNNQRIESLPGLSGLIPNFFIPTYGSKVSTPVYIRGIGARLGSQTVSMYVDNVPSFNPSAFDFEFQDIQRVEVLRGAQGTLYGRNAIGGIVNVYTLSPLTYQGMNAMVSTGNHGQFAAKGAVYNKYGEKFGVSATGYYKKDDGYFINNYTGKNADDSENAGTRLKFEWDITPAIAAKLFTHYDYVSQGAFPYMHEDSAAVNFNEPSYYKRHLLTNGLSLRYMGKGFSVNSTTGHQFLKDDMRMDQDYSPLSVFSIRQQQKEYSISQEITIKSENQHNYQWVVGAFGFSNHRTIDTPVAIKEDGMAAMQSILDALANNPNIPVVIQYLNNRIDLPGIYKKPSKGAALFHQSTVNHLFGIHGLSATGGIRFDYEHTGIDFFTESQGADVNISFKQLPMPDMQVNGDTVMQDNYSKTYWEILPKVALKYQPVPTAFAYLSASRGYKTGGYNEQAFSELLKNSLMESLMRNAMPARPGAGSPSSETADSGLEELLSYDPELSWTFELGGRCEMFDRRLSATFALFHTNVDSIQIVKLLDSGGGAGGRVVTNAGQSVSKGVEIGLRYNPTRNFTLYAEYGFADARFKKYHAGTEDYSGNYIPFAPQHTLSSGTSYVLNFNSSTLLNRLIINIQHTEAGKIYWKEDNSVFQPFYGLTNAGITAEKNAFALEIWGKNVFNTKYNSFYFEATDMITGNTNPFVQRGYPVRFGMSLKYTLSH